MLGGSRGGLTAKIHTYRRIEGLCGSVSHRGKPAILSPLQIFLTARMLAPCSQTKPMTATIHAT